MDGITSYVCAFYRVNDVGNSGSGARFDLEVCTSFRAISFVHLTPHGCSGKSPRESVYVQLQAFKSASEPGAALSGLPWHFLRVAMHANQFWTMN